MFEDAEMICIRRYVPIEYVKSVYGVADVVYEVLALIMTMLRMILEQPKQQMLLSRKYTAMISCM